MLPWAFWPLVPYCESLGLNRFVLLDEVPASAESWCIGRSMAIAYLLTVEPALAKVAYFQATDLLNLEVDPLFFDTTSAYFETVGGDDPVARDGRGERLPDDAPAEQAARRDGFRSHGKSKDSRDDLPQIVIGMAVTRDGIPVRVWSWPGNTCDQALLISQVRDGLREWNAVEGRLGRRPWLHLRRQPQGADAWRRRLHHRREAPHRIRRGAGRPLTAGGYATVCAGRPASAPRTRP
ncbi:hypothetical protein AB0M29_42510 [Streptomyces sp. NPDC051976]|uniref:hypothetical protein n=1 Tax=Streptomyces sp. NPDC051976 TaxID=3154947 RepID=UPI00342D6955